MISKHLIPVDELEQPIKFATTQLKVFWLPEEVTVEKDVQDILVNCSEAERHGIVTVLKLFALYETHAGSEYWGGRFKEIFKTSEFERMASVFSMFELAVHAPFYKKINQLLYLDNEEFYLDYLNDKVLSDRMSFIDEVINHPDPAVSIGAFSMVEGAILYSNFAFLKHFQTEGKNKATNIVRGINFSVRDEQIHSEAGAWCFSYLVKRESKLPYEDIFYKLAMKIYEHESEIIKKIFDKGEIEGINEKQLSNFVESRLNICLSQLGFKPLYKITYNPIADWFYSNINGYKFNDFFVGIGNEYKRDYDESDFEWQDNE